MRAQDEHISQMARALSRARREIASIRRELVAGETLMDSRGRPRMDDEGARREVARLDRLLAAIDRALQ